MERKEFIKNLARGGAVLVVAPSVLAACNNENEDPDPDNNPGDNQLILDLTDERYSQLASSGGFAYAGTLIVFNTGDAIVALSSKCTHQGCDVTYDAASGELPCPCHGSLFSSTGAVLEGPASSPLQEYPVTRDGDQVIIDL